MNRLFSILLLLTLCLTGEAQVGELPRSTLEAEGVNPQLFNSFCNTLFSLPDVDVHHLMVLRHDKVIAEMHAAPYQATDVHNLFSASKTVTALAIGLAVDDGLLSVDDKVSKFLRDKMPATLSPQLDSITVRHLLTMSSGRLEDLNICLGEADWLTTWFQGDFHDVGKVFHYDSMCTHALAYIIKRATGKPMFEYVKERIFAPLHITECDWELAPDSVEIAGWGLRLQTESEAKLGLLLHHGGNWNGQQLVSAQWIKDMTSRHLSTETGPKVELSWGNCIKRFFQSLWHTVRSWFTGYNVDDYYLGYGYQTKSILQPRAESYFAAGYGGQLIDVIPKLDLIIVINGRAANYGDELNTIYYRLVEPMIDDEQDIKAAPVALAIDLPQGEPTHPLEDKLLKRRIVLEKNLLGIESIDVDRTGDDLTFVMNDWRGPLRAVASCGQWRLTTSDERTIYITDCNPQFLGMKRPFTTAAAYAWQGDTLNLRFDWIDGGDNRRLSMAFDGDKVTVIGNDNFDALLTDTIQGKLGIRN